MVDFLLLSEKGNFAGIKNVWRWVGWWCKIFKIFKWKFINWVGTLHLFETHYDRSMMNLTFYNYLVCSKFCVCAKNASSILLESIKRLILKTKDFPVKSSSLKLWRPQIEDLFCNQKNHPISNLFQNEFLGNI